MNLRNTVLLALSALFLTACLQNATALRAVEMSNHDLAKKGSPYRIKAREVKGGVIMTQELTGTPTATLADAQLSADVLKSIVAAEKQQDPLADPTLIETRQMSASSEKVTEIWVVSRNDDKIPYVVEMRPSPQGGVDLNIQAWGPLPRM